MTDCGQKCFELQDTEYSLAVEKENNQKLEAEVKRLKGIIETACTSCCITEDLEHSLDELNYQNINQDGEIRQLKAQFEKLEADSASKDECIDNLKYQLKDAAGELELWQRENAELKKQNALLYEQEKIKIRVIEKMKNCLNCETGQKPVTREKIQFCCSCRGLDEQKENIIYKYWKLAE